MNKEQFLDELEKLLQDIDSIERDEALNYYRDYFEDAGSEHEQEVIDELGTPEKVAQTIKEGLGVENHQDIKPDINEQENEEVIHHYNERNTRILRGIIVVLLVLLILPTIGGVGGLVVAAFGLFLSIVCIGIFGTFGLLCALVALVVGAIKMVMDGLIAGGLVCLGVGLLLFSLSYLTSLMTVSIFKYLPQAFRALIDLGKDIYNKVVG